MLEFDYSNQQAMKVQNMSLKSKINQFKKIALTLLFVITISGVSQATGVTDSIAATYKSMNDKILVDLSGFEELPSITLVDKNLNVVAKFFGKPNDIKQEFRAIFDQATFLTEYNQRRLYLVSRAGN